jgi:RNA polymerase sigma-70 factor, ECF subfamily
MGLETAGDIQETPSGSTAQVSTMPGSALTATEERTDRDLLRAYAEASDRESLGIFVGRYQGSLVRFARRLLGDSEAAQDVVQDTFLQVARYPRRLLDVESCHNWLLRVVRNTGVSRIRRDSRARKHVEALGARVAAETGGTGGTAEAAEAAVERQEVRMRVRIEIDRLNPRYREVLLLKVEEDKSYKEIAEITGLTVTNVGYLLHRAMKDLTAKLDHAKEVLQ